MVKVNNWQKYEYEKVTRNVHKAGLVLPLRRCRRTIIAMLIARAGTSNCRNQGDYTF
jgi:hypothetical protein